MKTNKTKMDAVGKVVLNYNYYSGKDFYSEGASEDLLLEYVRKYKESDYDHVIQNSRSWSLMYHLSNQRENIASWLPIGKTDKVLEIGSGCGAITGCLANMAKSVTCIELSKKRSLINANRHKDLDNIEIVVGNFQDIEPEITEKYDYITLIGVLEYAASYIDSKEPYEEFLRRVGNHLSENGKLIIAIENKLGLKYFAGCKEDHTDRFFEGIEGYRNFSGVKTFSKDGLRSLLKETGFESKFYYPYPDYKLPHTIYSDSWLPKTDELNTNLRNFDNDRVVLFDETKVFNTFISEGKFDEVSNSFLVMATRKEIAKEEILPVYVKYANERSPKYRIVTIISSDYDGKNKTVHKKSSDTAANNHILNLYKNYDRLSEIFEAKGLKPNACKLNNEASNLAVELEFVKGITLEKYLDELEEGGNYERMLLLMKQYEAMVLMINKGKFEKSEGFSELFGDYALEGYDAAEICNLDMIFSNIVFDIDKKENGEWKILDYEWTFDFPIPARFVIYRALFYYSKSHENSKFFKYLSKRGKNLYREFKISPSEEKNFFEMEKRFQLSIIGKRASLEVMHSLMSNITLDFEQAIEDKLYLRNLNNPRLYYGTGLGFDNEHQLYIFGKVSNGNQVEIDIPLDKEVVELRVDPTDYPCIVSLNTAELIVKDEKIKLDRFLTNGYVGLNGTLLFDTNDAQIQFLKLPIAEKQIHLEYTVSMVDSKLFLELKQLFAQKMDRERKDPKMLDKVMVKCGMKVLEPIPAGLWYNKEGDLL